MVADAAAALYEALLRAAASRPAWTTAACVPATMLADIELIGIPHRVVVSERGLAAGNFEYRARRDSENRQLTDAEVFALFG